MRQTSFSALCLCLFLATVMSCTYTITMTHTEGTASDVVDQSSTPSATTDLKIPDVSGLIGA